MTGTVLSIRFEVGGYLGTGSARETRAEKNVPLETIFKNWVH